MFMGDNVRVFLACKPVDMRLGAPGLCAAVKRMLQADPMNGHLYIFRSRKGDYAKLVYFDGSGICLFSKRMERRHSFKWPRTTMDTCLPMSAGQLQLLIEGIDWRNVERPEPIPAPVML